MALTVSPKNNKTHGLVGLFAFYFEHCLGIFQFLTVVSGFVPEALRVQGMLAGSALGTEACIPLLRQLRFCSCTSAASRSL